MATPVELERLIVRLVGESSSYEKMMNNAIVKGQYVTDRLSDIGRRVEEAMETLQEAGARAVIGLEKPMERFNKRMANAGALLRTGAITYQEYGRIAEREQSRLVRGIEREYKERSRATEATARGQQQANAAKQKSDEAYIRFWAKELARQEKEEARVNAKRVKDHQRRIELLIQADENYKKRTQQIMDWFTDASEKRIRRELREQERAKAKAQRDAERLARHEQRMQDQTIRGQQKVAAEKKKADADYVRFWERELRKREREEKRVARELGRQWEQNVRQHEIAATRAYNAWNKSLNNIARISRGAGQTMTFGVTAPVAGAGVGSVKQFADFNDAMTGSLAVMENVSPKLKKQMDEMALNIADNSKTSAVDLAEGYYFLASAGYDAQQSLSALATVEKFAVAGRFQLQKATELLVDSQTALGMRSADAEQNMKNLVEVSDTLVKADTIANASVEQFARSLKTKAGNEARLLNKTVHETVAVLAAFAQQGVKAELAGERVYIVWRDLQRAARTNSEAFEHFNVRVYDSEGRMRKTWEIVQDLEKAFGGMSDQQRNAAFAAMGFQDRSSAAIKGLLGMSAAIKDYHDRLEDNTNFTQNVANVQLSSFTSQWQITLNRIRRVGIEIGQILLPYLQRGIEIIRGWVEWWRKLDDEQKKSVVRWAAIGASIGPILIGVSKMITLIVAARQAWTAYGLAISGANVSMTASVGIVAAWTAGVYLLSRALYNQNKDVKAYNTEVERGNKLLEQRLRLEGRHQEVALAMDPGSDQFTNRLAYEESRLLDFQKNIESYKAQLETLRKKYNAPGREGGSIGGSDLAEFIGNKEFEIAKRQIEEAERLYQNHLEFVEEMRERAKGKQAQDIPIATAAGEFADEDVPDFQAIEKATKALDRMNESLHTKYETLGLTTNELKVYQMALEGAGDVELRRAMHEARAIDLFEREEKIMKEMADEAEKSLSPWEKFRVEVAKLDELWEAGMIGIDGYRMKYSELESQMAKGLNLKFSTSGIDALEAGSAEAEAKLESFVLNKKLAEEGIRRAESTARPEFREGAEVTGFGRGFDHAFTSPTRLEELLEEIARNTSSERTHAGKRTKPVEVDWSNLEEE